MISNDSSVQEGRSLLAWSKLEFGHYVESTGRYRIYCDEGTWVLSCDGSLARNYSTLSAAKRAAEYQDGTGASRPETIRTITQGEIVRGEHGWVVVSKTRHGIWKEVAGPFPARWLARRAMREAWHDVLRG